jgi:hypothetical protein
MATSYEWCVEIVVRESDDIEDNNFVPSFAKAASFVQSVTDEDDGYDYRIVLVRTEGNEDEGVTDRLWAYVENGSLPEFFANAHGNATGVKVPQRFHKETK